MSEEQSQGTPAVDVSDIGDKKEEPPFINKRVVIEREGKQVQVDISYVDYSEGDKSKPMEIYCQGFGQGVQGISEFDDLLIKGEAKKLKAEFARVSIRNIPPPYDKDSNRDAEPSFGVDARIILEALQKESIDAVSRPAIISGYSEGAGVAVALAGEIDKRQKELSQSGAVLPSNRLRLWSLTSTMDLEPKPRGTTVAIDFIKEVSKIAVIEMAERYMNVTGEQVSIKDSTDLLNFLGKFSAFAANPKNWDVFLGQLKESREKNIGLLGGVLGRILSSQKPFDALEQLKKMETRSPVCDQLGKNWEVRMVVPRNDLIYPWWKVRRTIRQLKEQKRPVEVLSPDTPGDFNPDIAVKLTDLGQRYLFPNAGTVSFQVIGESKTFYGKRGEESGMSLGQVHVGPENKPDWFFDASTFAPK